MSYANNIAAGINSMADALDAYSVIYRFFI